MFIIYILLSGAISNDTLIMAGIGIFSVGVSIFTSRLVTIRSIDKAINKKIDRTEVNKKLTDLENIIDVKTNLKIDKVDQRIDSTQEFYNQLKLDNANGHNEIKGLLKEIRDKL